MEERGEGEKKFKKGEEEREKVYLKFPKCNKQKCSILTLNVNIKYSTISHLIFFIFQFCKTNYTPTFLSK